RVRRLASSELESHLDFMTLLEEPDGVFEFELQVVGLGAGFDPNALDLRDVSILSCLALLLGLFVFVLAVVEDPAHGRLRHRGHLDQIETPIARQGESIARRHDAELIAVGIDDADLRHTDTMVEARAKVPRRTTVKLSVYRTLLSRNVRTVTKT